MSTGPRLAEAVFVAGSGRSGTSTFAGVLRRLGLRVPLPEVVADDSNPRGFNEPRWMVDFHDTHLRRAGVGVADPRPDAAAEITRSTSAVDLRLTATSWLGEQLAGGDGLVLKDPRLVWFIDMWRQAARTAGARPSFATMLRPPPEVVGSKTAYYGRQQAADGVAMWVNGMLQTELATRGAPRAFVVYEDLLAHWSTTVGQAARTLGIEQALATDGASIQRVDEFVDPGLRRIAVTWSDLSLPADLQDIAERAWDHFSVLAVPDGDTPAAYAVADGLRDEFADAHNRLDRASTYRRVRKLIPRRAFRFLPPRLRSRIGRITRRVIEDHV